MLELTRPRSSGGGKGVPPGPCWGAASPLASPPSCLARCCSLPSNAAHSHVCPVRESTSSETPGIMWVTALEKISPLLGQECPPDRWRTPGPRSGASVTGRMGAQGRRRLCDLLATARFASRPLTFSFLHSLPPDALSLPHRALGKPRTEMPSPDATLFDTPRVPAGTSA